MEQNQGLQWLFYCWPMISDHLKPMHILDLKSDLRRSLLFSWNLPGSKNEGYNNHRNQLSGGKFYKTFPSFHTCYEWFIDNHFNLFRWGFEVQGKIWGLQVNLRGSIYEGYKNYKYWLGNRNCWNAVHSGPLCAWMKFSSIWWLRRRGCIC